MADLKTIPDIDEMKESLQKHIDNRTLSTKGTHEHSLSKHTRWVFTKLGKERGFYVRTKNDFPELLTEKTQYPNDGELLAIDLVWLEDNPYHSLSNSDIYDWHRKEKTKSEISLALEYETTGGINIRESDVPIHQCDELWKLSFVMARVKVLVYATSTDKIEKHLAVFRKAISNFGIRQEPEPEWRIFAINGNKVIGKKISPE